MATIDNLKIPPEIVDELKGMLAEAPDDAILAYAKTTNTLAKGFRPGSRKSVAPLRARILRSLASDHELDVFLRGLMALGGLSISLTSHMSELAIAEAMHALAVIHGRNRLLAALLVDYRDEVRKMAADILEGRSRLDEMSLDEAREEIVACFEPILMVMQEWVAGETAPEDGSPGDQAPPRPATSADTVKLTARIAELEDKLKEETEAARSGKALRKKLDVLTAQRQKLDTQLMEAGKRLAAEMRARADLKLQLQQACDEKEALAVTLADKIAAGVASELESARNRWLKAPLAVEREAETVRRGSAPVDWLEQAEQVLRKQADIDRHSGNLSVLRDRIGKLETARRKVAVALAEALRPLPELNRVEAGLNEEIARLRTLTGEKAERGGEFVAHMLARINTAESEDELINLQDILNRLDELKTFPPPDLQTLYRGCHNRMSRIYAAFTPTVIHKKQYPRDPVWRLRNTVEQNQDMLIVLDGHNVVHLLPNLFGDSYENGVPGAATRRKLVDMMVMVFSGATNCQAEVFFDGPTPSRERRAGNVWEVYSGGGQEQHRADKAIVDHLQYCCQTMSAMPRLLVTDDRDLRTRAVELGAKFMPVPQFGAFLEEMTQ